MMIYRERAERASDPDDLRQRTSNSLWKQHRSNTTRTAQQHTTTTSRLVSLRQLVPPAVVQRGRVVSLTQPFAWWLRSDSLDEQHQGLLQAQLLGARSARAERSHVTLPRYLGARRTESRHRHVTATSTLSHVAPDGQPTAPRWQGRYRVFNRCNLSSSIFLLPF
jgi:hypothetical protein